MGGLFKGYQTRRNTHIWHMVRAAELFGLEENIASNLTSRREEKRSKKEKMIRKRGNNREKGARTIPHHSRTISRTIRHLI